MGELPGLMLNAQRLTHIRYFGDNYSIAKFNLPIERGHSL
jgi:hypothetical protein